MKGSGNPSLSAERRIPELDGIRGIAIIMVLAVHARNVWGGDASLPFLLDAPFAISWSGVDLFFVLSGFLITGILLDAKGSPTFFRTFYLRRALRIFPLYFAYLALILLGVRALFRVHGPDLWSTVNLWSYLSYTANLRPDHGQQDIFLSHLWSLCIEEQFYLVWPCVIYFVKARALPWICGVVAVVCPLVRLIMYAKGFAAFDVHMYTFTRMDALAIGGLLAILSRTAPQLLRRVTAPAGIAAGVALSYIVLIRHDVNFSSPLMGVVGVSLLSLFYASVISGLTIGIWPTISALSAGPALIAIGQRSYAMYVLHLIPFELTRRAVQNSGSPVLKFMYFPLLLAISYAMAGVSWIILEQPFIRLRRFTSYRPAERPLVD